MPAKRTNGPLVLCCLFRAFAFAADPPEGALSCRRRDDCAAAVLEWTGSFSPALSPGLPEQCTSGAGQLCDRFRFVLELPQGYWADHPGSLEVAIRWETDSTDEDLDLFVYRDGEEVARSVGQDSEAEVAFLDAPPNGTYEVLVVPVSLDEDKPYQGRIEIEDAVAPQPLRDLLPNLVTLEPKNLRIASAEYLIDPVHDTLVSCYPEETVEDGAGLPRTPGDAPRCLRFDQVAANVGEGPLELRYRPGVEPDLRQIVHRSDGTTREITAEEKMDFHPVHGHWHYRGFGLGRLYDSAGALVRENHKNGFCLIEVDFPGWGAKGNSPRRFSYPGCQLPNDGEDVVQGIGPGWADVYNWFLADQYIDVTGLPDGDYRLEIVADPDDTLLESNENDNAHSTWIRLRGMEVCKVASPGGDCRP
jgi:hypothetical protein